MAVLWMETYLLYCSVRLGLLVVALFGFLQVFMPAVLLLSMGMDALDPILKLFKNDEHYGKNYVILKILNWIENHVQGCIALVVTFLTIHMISCGLAIFGALKLKKWFLLPFIINELIRVVVCFATHIILMIILKKKLNLGLLIAVTLLGGFLILYLGYNWATSVALFQIIELIHTERYRQLYGDDPFNPQLPFASSFASPPLHSHPGYGIVENVRVLVTPRSGDIDAQKQQQTQSTTMKFKPVPVIAVIPASYKNSNAPLWYSKPGSKQSKPFQEYESAQNDYNVAFGNWQWSELMVGRQRKALISRNW